MSTVKGIRIKNALLGGSITGAELETLLTDPANLGPYIEQINLRGAIRSLTQVPQAMSAMAASQIAMDTVAVSQVAMYAIYSSPIAVAAIFGPQRYAIYAPHPDQITVKGSGVSEWRDVSGNNRNFVQGFDASRPAYTSTIGDYTVPNFDGSTDFLQNSSSFGTLGANWAALTVYRREVVGNGSVIFGDNSDSLAASVTANNAGFVNNNSDQTNRPVHAEKTVGVVRWVASGGTGAINGVTAGVAPDFSGTTKSIGVGVANGNTRYFDGDIAEIVFFSGGFSTADVDRVERMLKIKYGLPL